MCCMKTNKMLHFKIIHYTFKTLSVLHYNFIICGNNQYTCGNNEAIYRNNELKYWEQKNRIISHFISIIGSSLITGHLVKTCATKAAICTDIKCLQLTKYNHLFMAILLWICTNNSFDAHLWPQNLRIMGYALRIIGTFLG